MYGLRGGFTSLMLLALAMQTTASSQQPALYQETVSPSIDVEYGSSRPILDAAGWVVGIPRKIMLLNSRVDNHRVSDETVASVADYLARRDVGGVKVRVNQWDPIGEWQRLVDNKNVGAGWKYTVGTLHHIRYLVAPGRLFGGEYYNPFTDTVNIFSDVPELGLVESAYAHDVRSKTHPGTYATVQSLPLVSLWHETKATDDVLRYVALYGTPEEVRRARRLLYSRYGSAVGGELGSVVPAGDALKWVGAGAGHLTALERNRRAQTPQQ